MSMKRALPISGQLKLKFLGNRHFTQWRFLFYPILRINPAEL